MSAGRHIYVSNLERRAIISAAALFDATYSDEDNWDDDLMSDVKEHSEALSRLIKKLTK